MSDWPAFLRSLEAIAPIPSFEPVQRGKPLQGRPRIALLSQLNHISLRDVPDATLTECVVSLHAQMDVSTLRYQHRACCIVFASTASSLRRLSHLYYRLSLTRTRRARSARSKQLVVVRRSRHASNSTARSALRSRGGRRRW